MASFPTPNNIINALASTNLSGSQFKAVVLTATGTVVVASTNAKAIGFLMNKPIEGQICEIATFGGGGKGISAASIAAGQLVKTDTNGDLVSASVAPDVAVAITLEPSVSGQIFALMPILNHI